MPDPAARFPAGATWLGVVKHPSTGIRLPELFLPGILTALKKRHCPGTLSLSFGRETAPEAVINAAVGTWEITRGHTGTSIREYMTLGAMAAERAGVAVELEADHLIITGSQAQALRRLVGNHSSCAIDEDRLEQSLAYYRDCIDEAARVGVVSCFTVDASELYWQGVARLAPKEVRATFAETFPAAEAASLLARYARPFHFPAPGGRTVRVTLTALQAMRLALRFRESLRASARIYDYCKAALGERPFSWEIALDETAQVTSARETLFYLTEWKAMGYPCHYVGPNLGFTKRTDYEGDLEALRRRARQQHAIARGVAGALLSIHSGDGANPYSGKGEGIYDALLDATGGDLKFKISDVYYELLMELLAALSPGSEGRALYESIFDEVEALLRAEARTGGPLATPALERQLAQYDAAVRADPRTRRHPRTQWFRFNAFLALNMRRDDGRRRLREGLLEYVRRDAAFRRRLDEEIEALTLRMIDGLRLGRPAPP